MKKVTFTTRPQGNNDRKPMGIWGILLRLFLFLIALGALIVLLSLFHRCDLRTDGGRNGGGDGQREIVTPPDSLIDVPENPDFGDTPLPPRGIENPGRNLPPDNENVIPPYDDDEIQRDDNGREVVNDRLNVILDSDAGDDTFNRWSDAFKEVYPGDDYRVVFYEPLTKLIQIQVPAEALDEVMRVLPERITDINFRIFPESIFEGHSEVRPNDPAFRDRNASWYFAPIQAYEAWGITQGSENITVAVVDSYFDLRHPDLYSDRIVAPYSVVKRNRDVAPDPGVPETEATYYHGSCVSSMAIANVDNGNGACGIAPLCKYMPVSMGSRFTTMTMMSGVLYAIYQGADVVNVSAGLYFSESLQLAPIEDQIELARTLYTEEASVWEFIFELAQERNVTIVWAAGNCNVVAAIDPSKRDSTTIRVSALDRQGQKATFSNYGEYEQYGMQCSDISAPGVDIYGAVPGGRYTMGPGTSYSAPIVTGAIALMKSVDSTLTTNQIREILRETGRPVQGGDATVGPMLQIYDALQRVQARMSERPDSIQRNASSMLR